MPMLKFTYFPQPARTAGQLRKSYRLLRTALRGRHIVSVTEERYAENERRLFARMAERLQATSEVVPYGRFIENPGSVKADIIMLRTSKLFVVSFSQIIGALEGLRSANPHSAVIASVLDSHAFDVLTSRPEIVNLVDTGATTNDHDLLAKGAQVLERLA